MKTCVDKLKKNSGGAPQIVISLLIKFEHSQPAPDDPLYYDKSLQTIIYY